MSSPDTYRTPDSRPPTSGAPTAGRTRWPAYSHVIFDCDATLSTIEGIDSLADDAAHLAQIESLTHDAMSGRIDLADVYTRRLDVLRPSRARIGAIRDDYRRAVVPGAAEVVSTLLELGHHVYVVSGGLAEPVREFATKLGIPLENVHAVETRHDALSGEWWNSGGAEHAYSGHADSPLTTSEGKASVIAGILAGHEGRSMLVGDGVTDLMAAGAVDLFVGFGGVTRRDVVAERADVYIEGPALDAVLALAAGTPGREAITDDVGRATFERGLHDVSRGGVTFRSPDVEGRFIAAFDVKRKDTDMTTPKILVCDALGAAGSELLEAADDVDVIVSTGLDREALLAAVSNVDAIIVRSATTIDAEVLAAAARLQVVGRAGVGTDNIDVPAATRRGVLVTNTPHANTIATAEQAMALLLAAARHTPAAHASVASGVWERSRFMGVELKGKTLGVIGFGRIGRAVAARAKAFDMKIVAYDPFVSESVGRDHGVVLENLDRLLADSDFVTLHAVAPSDGSALLDAAAIAVMKRGATIINAARGQLLDAAAAREALDSGQLRAVAVDVFDAEPPPADHPLVGHPRVVHTPHLGASTVEAQRDVSINIVEQVLAALRGERVDNCVNLPFVFDAETEAQLTVASAMGRLQGVMADGVVTRVEVDVANASDDLVATVAAGVLAGLVSGSTDVPVNYINAPSLALERGITVAQGHGIGRLDYPNLISCRVTWEGGSRAMSGVVFGGKEPRIVQISDYHLDARPEGVVLLMLNEDRPGVIREVGTLLGQMGVNIAEWRLGRNVEGGLALSFINLDVPPAPEVLEALRHVDAVTKAEVVEL